VTPENSLNIFTLLGKDSSLTGLQTLILPGNLAHLSKDFIIGVEESNCITYEGWVKLFFYESWVKLFTSFSFLSSIKAIFILLDEARYR
jgi:hypothetical protein